MKLGFLGYGNLARAIDRGINNLDLLPAKDIYISAKTEATLAYARSKGHGTCSEASELFAICDIVIIAVKPKVFFEMTPELSRINTRGKLAVSLMAAVHLDVLEKVLRCPVMRVMPTLAAADSVDVIGYAHSGTLNPAFEPFLAIISELGEVLRLEENMLDRLTVAAACGLGFAAHILEVYQNKCIDYGFTTEQSEMITRRMFSYAADGGGEDSTGFAGLKSRVATKGGATEAGNMAMDAPLKEALTAAFDAAGERAIPKK